MTRHNHFHRRHPQNDREKKNNKNDNKRDDKRDTKDKPAKVVSVVYVTASPTFSGPIGGYSTLGPAIPQASEPARPATQQAPPPSPPAPSPPAPAPSVQTGSGSKGDANAQVPPPPQTPASQPKSDGDGDDDAPQKPAAIQQPPQSSGKADSSPVVQIQSASSRPSTAPSSQRPAASTSPRAASPIASPSAVPAKSSSPGPLTSSLVSSSTPRPTGTTLLNSSASSVSSPAVVQSAAPSSSSSEGLTGGAKAGIALGLLIGIGAILALLLFCLKRRKKQQEYMMADDEKSRFSHQTKQVGGGEINRMSSVRTTRTATNAPRLSLRPVTQFQPDLANGKGPGGNSGVAGVAGGSPGTNLLVPGAQPNKSPNMNSTNDPTNPFGTHAESSSHITTGLSPPPPVGAGNRTTAWPTPFTNSTESQGNPVESGTGAASVDPTVGTTVLATSQHPGSPKVNDTTAKAVSAGDTLTTSATPSMSNQQGPGNVEGNMLAAMPAPPPSPQASTMAAAAAAAGGSFKNAPVHRVQMDFKPSMSDELELRVGQLVRILHEYDDGWARCVRLDGSETGVAPRTCMSSRPVKPRPITPAQGSRGNHPNAPVPPGGRVPIPIQVRKGNGMGSPKLGDPAGPIRSGSPAPLNPANGRHSPSPYKAYSPGPLSPTSSNSGRNSPVAPPYAAPPRPRSPASGSRSNSPVPRAATPTGHQVLGAASAAQQLSRPSPRIASPGPNNQTTSTIPPPQTLPTVLRSGSPQPSSTRSNSPPSRKPLPGQAM